MLLHARPTSEVHLLSGPAARIFLAADGQKTAAQLVRETSASGAQKPEEAGAAVKALLANRLLRG